MENTSKPNTNLETAAFGAGCFWGVEETFRNTKGVHDTAVGYMGGTLPNPTYEDVCGKRTGHAETVEVKYDPKEVSFEKLLGVFFENHDPTTMNRQGPDVGSQYRSIVFYYSPEQKATAEMVKENLEKSHKYDLPIVTEIVAARGFPFYKAEDYHQQYLSKRGLGTCHI